MGNRTVLFVDDEVNVLNSLKRGLIGEDYDCITAESAQMALDILEHQQISVIVTDMRMPGMDGLSLLKVVKEKYPSTVRVVLSGYTHFQQVLLAINQGDIYKFITKPWKIEDEFKPIIRQAIEYHELIIGKEEFNKALEAKNASIQNILRAMDERLTMSKKDYDNIQKFYMGILEFIMSEIRIPKFANNGMEEYFDLVCRFCAGFFNTFPSENREFEPVRLLEEISDNVAKAPNFKEVSTGIKCAENTVCRGNFGLAAFVVVFIIKYAGSQNSSNQVKIGIVSNKDRKIANLDINAEVRAYNTNDEPSGKPVPDKLFFLEKLLNAAIKYSNSAVIVKNQGNCVFINYKTLFLLKSFQD